MEKNLCRKVGEIGQDNLVAKLFPPAETFGIKVAGGEGHLKRGTVMALTEEGNFGVLDSTAADAGIKTQPENDEEGGTTPTTPTAAPEANCILADDVDASGEDDVTAVAYRTGHFNRKALIVADGYIMTIKDEEILRKGGILLSDMAD